MLLVLSGVLSWLVAEYWIHRMLGHVLRFENPFRSEHLKHHIEGNYFAPAAKKALAAVVFLPVITGVAWLLLPLRGALLYASGLIGMYLLYEVIHYGIHAWPARTPYGKWIARHHLVHHFNTATKNHAVSFPLFDRLWGTHRAVEQVRVPRKLAPHWMRALPDDRWTVAGTTFQVFD